jgi:hypothetical protein
MTRSELITCAAIALSLAACRKEPSAPGAPPPACAAHASLEQIDTRVAVPLLPMMANHQKQSMRDHLLAVQEIVLAAGRDDFSAVETAAGRIGLSPQMGQMCTHMGAATPGFTDQALAFHRTADSIASAARRHDRGAVMRALGTTLQACTGCHETFRQRVVDQATWSQLTATAPGTAHAPGLSSRP